MWTLDQRQQCLLGACERCRFPGQPRPAESDTPRCFTPTLPMGSGKWRRTGSFQKGLELDVL